MISNIEQIKTPKDILEYMDNIQYGYLDIEGNKHINTLKKFRRLYKTMTIEEVLEYKIGTCIEQVLLMSLLQDKLGILNKKYCTRIYERKDFNNLDEEEHMHCFILYFIDNKVYQIEHPNRERIGIYEYTDLESAIKEINEYYVKMANGKSKPVTEFTTISSGLTFKQVNEYINSLDEQKKKV